MNAALQTSKTGRRCLTAAVIPMGPYSCRHPHGESLLQLYANLGCMRTLQISKTAAKIGELADGLVIPSLSPSVVHAANVDCPRA